MNLYEAVKSAVTTRQVAEAYGIRINRSGMACCPFHNDKTPSMKLDKRFHCFGCGADGDVINFVAALFDLNNKEAAEKLAADFNVGYENWKPPDRQKQRQSQLRKLNMSAYIRKMALDGYCVNLDLSDVKERFTCSASAVTI